MQYQQILDEWLQFATEDRDIAAELKDLQARNDEASIADRFYRQLAFGTGGLRGVLGAGTNRINIYTVRKATQGLAAFLRAQPNCTGVAIAYDSRRNSLLFAQETARVLAGNNIKAYLYPRLMPTPSLSFAVRHLGLSAGVCITASHNPAEYNGYKVYGSDGCQITTEAAKAIQNEIAGVNPFVVNIANYQQALQAGSIHMIGEEVVDSYLQAVLSQRLRTAPNNGLFVAYTPLHGAGLECVSKALQASGTSFVVEPQQKQPDGNFPTCPYPNPEIKQAMELGLALAKQNNADLLLATDPDCDRLGVAVKGPQGYQLLTGNEVGLLLLDYICKQRTAQGCMPGQPVAVKTIVTTAMAKPLAASYNVQLREVLTGFKYIGEQIGLLESQGRAQDYIFGFEESNGYLSGSYVRDKDGVNAALLVCDMAATYKEQGKTLLDMLQQLYNTYGYYKTDLLSFTYKGAEGMEKMQQIMEDLRQKGLPQTDVQGVYDYLQGQGSGVLAGVQKGLPAENVLEFLLPNDAGLIVRPSGTEPKIKIYLTAKGKTPAEANQVLAGLQALVQKVMA